jgi:hypothetical protein
MAARRNGALSRRRGRWLSWTLPARRWPFRRDHVVHVAIAPGRLGERLAIEAARLGGLRRDGGGGKTGADEQTQTDGANG